MFEKLEEVASRYDELDRQLSDPGVFNDRQNYQKLTSERSKIEPIVESYQRYCKVRRDIDDNRTLLKDSDADIREMAQSEISELEEELERLEQELRVMLLPRDPRDEKNVLLEIRGGTGGEEAALFAYDLFRMYCKYAENRNWKVQEAAVRCMMAMIERGVLSLPPETERRIRNIPMKGIDFLPFFPLQKTWDSFLRQRLEQRSVESTPGPQAAGGNGVEESGRQDR